MTNVRSLLIATALVLAACSATVTPNASQPQTGNSANGSGTALPAQQIIATPSCYVQTGPGQAAGTQGQVSGEVNTQTTTAAQSGQSFTSTGGSGSQGSGTGANKVLSPEELATSQAVFEKSNRTGPGETTPVTPGISEPPGPGQVPPKGASVPGGSETPRLLPCTPTPQSTPYLSPNPGGPEDSTLSPMGSSDAAAISPANGSRVCLQPGISVNLGLTDATRKDGVLDMTKIKLTVDGTDVTGKATVLGTMDYPQSHATITYMPDQPLGAGKHTASITMAAPTGDKTYQWTFETADIPCQ